MTNYPTGIDTTITLPPATGDDAVSVNANSTAIEAIEAELGILPAGVYATVRTRLDILEARINNPLAPAPNVNNPFYIGGSPISGVSIQVGFGDPGILKVPAIPGSLYLREDGYSYQSLYSRGVDGYWHQVLISGTGFPVIYQTKTITANYTVDSSGIDYFVFCNAPSAINVILSQPVAGRQLVIKDISGNASANPITILPFSHEKIEGASSKIINTNYGFLKLSTDGTNWFIV